MYMGKRVFYRVFVDYGDGWTEQIVAVISFGYEYILHNQSIQIWQKRDGEYY